MNERLSNKMNKNGIIGILLLVIICCAGFYLYKASARSDDEIITSKLDFKESQKADEIVLKEFNPNDLDKNGWIALGFSDHEANTILNWKDVLGGNFSDKGQLKKCYAISEEKYAQIESYIQLPETKAKNFK